MVTSDLNISIIRRIKEADRIALIDADLICGGTRHPNLAIMKLSGYCVAQGKTPVLLYDKQAYEKIFSYDLVFISKVFSYSETPKELDKYPNVVIGGTGFFEDGGSDLPEEIEHCFPDYSIYSDYIDFQIEERGRSRAWFADYLDYSIGFLTRGCFRQCSFCVNKKYKRAIPHSALEEFVDDNRPYIYLWDDNFFACSEWESLLQKLIEYGKPFQFRQGLDIRLLTEKKAKYLSRCKYRGDMIFAFDHIEDSDLIESKLKLWRAYSSKGTRLYVLCAYDSQDEIDIENTLKRIAILMKYGCLPYIMRYESYKESRWRGLYIQLARWCNQPQFFKKMSFRQFCNANQKYTKTDRICSSLKAMNEFEEAFPTIAAKYFDLKYEEENMYGEYNYYCKTLVGDCGFCNGSQVSWQQIVEKNDIASLAKSYLLGNLETECLRRGMHECSIKPEEAASYTIHSLIDVSYDFLVGLLQETESHQYISASNIPQFSNLKDALVEVPKIVVRYDSSLSYDEIGTFLDSGAGKTDLARKKYGENHSKLAAQLGLVNLAKGNSNNWEVSQSDFTKEYLEFSEDEKASVASRLMLRIPVIRAIIRKAVTGQVSIDDFLFPLSESTALRRKSNIKALIQYISEHSGDAPMTIAALKNIG